MWNWSLTTEQHYWHFYTTCQVFAFDFLRQQPESNYSLPCSLRCVTHCQLSHCFPSRLTNKAMLHSELPVPHWTESLWCLTCMCSRQCWKGRGYSRDGNHSLKQEKLFRMLNTWLYICYDLWFHHCNPYFHSWSCFALINESLISNIFKLGKKRCWI